MRQAAPPREKRKISNTINTAINGDDVRDLWKKAKTRGAQPSDLMNVWLAGVMNRYAFGNIIVDETSYDSLKSVRTLIEDKCNDLVLLGSDKGSFLQMLLRLEPLMSDRHEQAQIDWTRMIAKIIWEAVGKVLGEMQDQDHGTSRNSVAVQVTAMALNRMGWNRIGAPGIEAMLQEQRKLAPR